MAKTNLVRPSRDGDQFHYLWASRRCLQLLSSQSGLVAISIEGSSPNERGGKLTVGSGDEVIDIAEYFGSEHIKNANLIRYMQLKHSTRQTTKQWTASDLNKTIQGFAKYYNELRQNFPNDALESKLEFWFITNRPISTDFIDAVNDAAVGSAPRNPSELKKLQRITKLRADELSIFSKMLRFHGRQDDYWEQRNILSQDVQGYLTDADVDGPLKLKELVTRKALSEGESKPTITKMDVLRALGTDENLLFPAPCLIGSLDAAVPRAQEPDLVRAIESATAPVIIHASGGVGKTVFAMRVAQILPDGSQCIVYDCFGNGQYRNASGYRHRHKDALVQIANELAARCLCHPLIPTSRADASDYMRAFINRINQASKLIRLTNPQSFLCIVVDAADNAQMAAEETGVSRSFVRDLIREKMPTNVRLIFLCRSYRQFYLDPPIEVIRLELLPFNREETATYLRQMFPDATERDIDEFHRLSSSNPRVQAHALSQNNTLPDTLRLLGPNPMTVEDTIKNLLENSIAKLKDSVGPLERDQVNSICVGLAALRPLIPISILSQMSGVDEIAIKSFASDLERPLLVVGGTVQFRDEPAETWFREKFKPSASAMTEFITKLTPLAATSTYVASTLPQLMLEAGKFSELVELALTSTALPETSPLEKRDVELQRLQFALKAGLRSRRYLDAAKLALKAGGETAGDDRQRDILQANTDLAAIFVTSDLIQELVSRRTFGSDWVGSHHAYEAALLSGRPELVGDARSRLRMADEWVRNWAQLPPEERKKEEVSDQDIAELTLARVNIHGPADGAKSLRAWQPRDVSFRVGRIVARRLIDHGRLQDMEEFARAAGNNLCLVLAVTVELREIQQTPPADVTSRGFRLVADRRIKLRDDRPGDDQRSTLSAVTAIVEASLQHSVCTPEEAAMVLSRYLPSEPPRGLSSSFTRSRFPTLRAYCLRAALQGKALELRDLASVELKSELDKKDRHATSRDLHEFQDVIGAVLPWHQLWAATFIGRINKVLLDTELKLTYEAYKSATVNYYRDDSPMSNEIALLWIDILFRLDAMDDAFLNFFSQWKSKLKRPLFTSTLMDCARLCGQNKATKVMALKFTHEAFNLIKDERSGAESKSEGYIKAARAILTVSKPEADAYFNEAVEVASKIGGENLLRWDAILDLADRAARADRPSPEVAYNFARCAELTYAYVDRDKYFNWQGTIEALCGLCPSSTLAILSRWRDRKFGWPVRILPIAVDRLIERGSLDARDALPLIGYHAHWTYDKFLGRTLYACVTHDEKEAAAAYLYRYMQFSDESFSGVKDIVSQYNVKLPGLDEIIAFEEISKVPDRTTEYLPEAVRGRPIRNWDDVFAGNDLTNADGLSRSYAAFENTEPPRGYELFFQEAIQRVPVGFEADFIKAVGNTPEFDLYHFREFFKQLPDAWKGRLATTRALIDTVRTYCRHYCLKIEKNRYYEVFPFRAVGLFTGLSEADISAMVLDAIGMAPDHANAHRLFSLVGLLAINLSEDEALDALIFGLNFFTPTLKDHDGDGPWSDNLLPPIDIKMSLAGYIWASMAAPEGVLRWEGSHTVMGLVTLGRREILANIMKLAIEQVGGPFVDSTLYFYKLHALQWFLIGIARAADDYPEMLAPFSRQIVDWALTNKHHVLIRKFAAHAALALIKCGLLADQENIKARLARINESPLPVVESKYYDRIHPKMRKASAVSDDDHYYFDIDIGPYWYEPLGRVFALSRSEVEAAALRIIRTEFNYTAKGSWDEDYRSRRNLYEENHAYHSHGSHPRADTLHFYHAYHAMMLLAGKLLATTPTHRDLSWGDEDGFADWLNRHDLSRKDGRWLWDRRDPTPRERPAWLDRDKDDKTLRVVTMEDFDEALHSGEMLNVWGDWTVADSYHEQSVHISSAFVQPDKSHALLRALGTAKDVNEYALPSFKSDMEIDESGFVLKGWIVDYARGDGLDNQDRWAGGISFPPPRPARYINDAMGLKTDLDLRVWKDGGDSIVMTSQMWGHYDEAKRYESSNPEHGSKLQAALYFLATMLSKFKKDLIIEVQIDRRRRYQPYERGKEDGEERILTRARLYLLGADGRLQTL